MSDKTFIETQFPISKLSAESYKERKANLGQTLTRLGKWWGRKPLVLVRACVLGMLLPASADPKRDREVFLKLMTMDGDGLWRRRKGTVADKDLLAESPERKGEWKEADKEEREQLRERIWAGLTPEAVTRLESKVRFPLSRREFDELPYEERLAYCERPENASGPSAEAWIEINRHLGTKAGSLDELVRELGERQFGHRPRVGDCFCGGGSIPFEAARIGCDSFGSDLNPVAALLTWSSLHLVGGGRAVQERVRAAQAEAFEKARAKVEEWGIERNAKGWSADAFLYCVEVKPPGCPYAIPLAPSWLIGERSRVIGKLKLNAHGDRIDIDIVTNPSVADWERARAGSQPEGTGTVKEGRLVDPFDPSRSWSMESLRGPQGLRRWDFDDLVPKASDTFQERLYCVRWTKGDGSRAYAAPSPADLEREELVLVLLRQKLAEWRVRGILPSREIARGYNTEQPLRERGWTHWHHLFAPRQLLLNGLLVEMMAAGDQALAAAAMLGSGRLANWNSRLCRWLADKANEKGSDVFSNQALNTLFNFSVRPLAKLDTAWPLFDEWRDAFIASRVAVVAGDARDIREEQDLWITDPPYADAVNYHELGDFFLAWYDKALLKAFPGWYADGKAALAVRGTGDDFKKSMVEVYSNLARHMPDNGLQMVQFTHQDPAVWADLGMILWAAGLRVTAAWTVATETPAGGIKKGNYVQGTVLLVLRKRLEAQDGFLDEIYPQVEDEVRRQIDTMRELDDASEPNFGDTDYQLAAYAAALRVLTQYQTLDGQDVGHELFRAPAATAGGEASGRGARGQAREKSRFEKVIERAIEIACDYLVPRGLGEVWPGLAAEERLYLRALDVESRGERRQGVFQELARGFGVREVKPLLHSDKANGARVRTPSEFGRKDLGGDGFGGTKLRQLLFAVHTSIVEEKPQAGQRYLKDELRDYWGDRQRLIVLLDWIASVRELEGLQHWARDAEAARLLAGRLRADHG